MEIVNREMTVIYIGIPFLIDEGRGCSMIMQILENYRLLIECRPDYDISLLFTERYRREILRHQEENSTLLEHFHKCVAVYDDYCSMD